MLLPQHFIRLQLARLILLCSVLMLSACNAQLPDMKLTTIKGNNIQSKALANQVVLVSFWATSCKSCVEEMPDLIKTYNKYHDKGLEVLAISMQYDPPAQLATYTNQKALPFPVIHDSYGDIAFKFDGVQATPTAYIFNKAGKRIQHTVGTLNFKNLHALLDKELN